MDRTLNIIFIIFSLTLIIRLRGRLRRRSAKWGAGSETLYGLISASGYKAPPFIETKREVPIEGIFPNDLEGRVVRKHPKSEGKVGINGNECSPLSTTLRPFNYLSPAIFVCFYPL